MKSNIFEKHFDREVVDINCGYKEAVSRMQQLRGAGRSHPFSDYAYGNFGFYCNKKGEFFVGECRHREGADIFGRFSLYYVAGRVFVENNKTKAEFYSVKSRLVIGILHFTILLLLVLLGFSIYTALFTDVSNIREIIFTIACLILGIATGAYYLESRQNDKHTDLTNMREEVLRRIDAVNKWDKE